MAATGFTPISLYYSSTTGTSPTAGNLVAGELALNTFDGKLFYKDSSGVVQVIATKGTGTIGGSNTQVQYNSSGAFAGSANFVWDNSNVRLGIGTASPEQKFHISVASGNVYQQISSGANNIYFGYVSADAAASIQSNGAITFLSGGSYLERMRITSGGIALIGTTSASGSNLLQVNSDASISGLTVGKGAGTVATNTAVGVNALTLNTTSTQNTAIGYTALRDSTGASNTAVGAVALQVNTTGTSNTAVGSGVTATYAGALGNNTTGSYNTAMGVAALALNTTASSNTAVGYQAGYSQTTATYNAYLGTQVGYNISGGAGYNVAIGDRAMYGATSSTAQESIAIGPQALTAISTGNYNIAIGRQALYSNTTASYNTAVGYTALYSTTTSGYNTAVGYQSGYSNTTGLYNSYLGYQAGYGNTTGVSSVAIGYNALVTSSTGNYNIAIGQQALQANTTASNNVAIGFQSAYYNTTGASNTAIGYQSLISNTTASRNTAVGYQAGYTNTTGQYNTFLGYAAGYTQNASGNTLIGNQAGYSLTTGSSNTFIGTDSGATGSGEAVTTGSKNTILGRFTGNQGGLDIRTLSNRIVLSDGDGNPRAYWNNEGTQTTTASATDGYAFASTNSTATRPYGIWSKFSGTTPNNTTQTFLDCEDTTNQKLTIYSNGTVSNRTGTYNTLSDIKIKQDIIDATPQWDDIKAIRFRKYRLIDDVNANPDAPYLMGVVAQELQQTSPNLVEECFNREGEMTLGVKQSIIFMKATKALQEAMERIETLEAKLTALENK